MRLPPLRERANRLRAAQRLGMTRRQFTYRLEKLALAGAGA
jgi:transcriptional regulator with GAF, ATPase, and Fis domain